MASGILIVIEGIDGAGKTTQVHLLGDALERAGETVVLSKEPTDGKWGRLVRESARTGRLAPRGLSQGAPLPVLGDCLFRLRFVLLPQSAER